ncbi:hypothetical protein BDZ88DRAFT_115365 [Geranomyces variabilis]|nr:hypothetical protein BDZ88DRAFT_115365 [Geranomyces variabilis]
MTQPIRRSVKTLATSVSVCSIQAAAYGKCVNSIFGDIQRNSCAKEFAVFKDCVAKAMKRP